MRPHWFIAIGLVALVASQQIVAQVSVGIGQRFNEIKALSAEEVSDLLQGRGTVPAKAAELNGYPGPAGTLGLAQDLGLSADQAMAVQRIKGRLDQAAVPLGLEILERELDLDRAFVQRTAVSGRIERLASTIAALRGQLRALHLTAHVETAALLHPWQINRYYELRDYQIAADAQADSISKR